MKKRLTIAVAVLLAVSSLAACGTKKEQKTNESKTADQAAGTSAESGEVKKIVVGLGNAWAPCDYLDENGNPAGYEYEVLKAVDELLPEYEFEFQPMDFNNILISLDEGKIDLASHTFTLNEERAAKYGYTEESHYQNVVYIVVSKDNTDIHSVDDLQGKNVFASTGEASAEFLEEYNKEHPDNPINLKYEAFTMEQVVAEISNGTMDAWYCNQGYLDDLNAGYGDKLKAAEEPLYSVDSIFYLDKDNTELKEALDGAIKKLREDGTLKKLSEETIGYDASGSDK